MWPHRSDACVPGGGAWGGGCSRLSSAWPRPVVPVAVPPAARMMEEEDLVEAVFSHLTSTVGLKPGPAREYAAGLVSEGYDSAEAFDQLRLEELGEDFGFKRGHLKIVEKYRALLSGNTPPQSPGTPRTPATGEPAGATLGDGSTVVILEDQRLGRGGSGVVYKATMTRRSGATEEVAAKVLAPGATEKEHQKFAREYDILVRASQQCAGVCRVYGCIIHNHSLCIVMKLYPQSLHDLMLSRVDPTDSAKHLPLSLPEALIIGLNVARALVGLHSNDIRVQDLKPSNLLIDDDGIPVVSDFGIAAIEGATITGSASKLGGGTPNYMCGELLEAEGITVKVDIWAWAAIFVQMVTGSIPWAGLSFQQVIAAVLVRKKTPTIPEGLPSELVALLHSCFSHDASKRPSAAHLVEKLRPMAEAESSPEVLLSMHANALLQGTWIKRELYTFESLTSAVKCEAPHLLQRYQEYKAKLASEGNEPNEHLLFHGCSDEALACITQDGFLKQFWTSAAGEWQRFGPGFYFALQSSKSHEYPLEMMSALPAGTHSRSMLLCKVLKGNVYRTTENMDKLTGAAPAGYHSVYGVGTPGGPLSFDELVVYEEAAILPYAIVTYQYSKIAQTQSVASEGTPTQNDLFVRKATGQLLSMAELFESEIPKSQCWSLAEAGAEARAKLCIGVANAKAQEKVLGDGAALVEATLADLEKNQELEHARIDMVITAYQTQLHKRIAYSYNAQKTGLELQQKLVAEQLAEQQQISACGIATMEQGDLAAVNACGSDLAADVVVAPAEPLSHIQPVHEGNIICQLPDLASQTPIFDAVAPTSEQTAMFTAAAADASAAIAIHIEKMAEILKEAGPTDLSDAGCALLAQSPHSLAMLGAGGVEGLVLAGMTEDDMRGLGMAPTDVAALTAAMRDFGPCAPVSAATGALALADVQTACYSLDNGRFVEQLRSHGCVLSDSAIALLLVAYHAESQQPDDPVNALFHKMRELMTDRQCQFSTPSELGEWLVRLRMFGNVYASGGNEQNHLMQGQQKILTQGVDGFSWEDVQQIATFFASLNQYRTALVRALKANNLAATVPWREIGPLEPKKLIVRRKELEFAMLGLQGAGKTTLVNVIAVGEFNEETVPTVGFNMRKVDKGNVTMKFWDLGGQPRFRGMWERYCRGVSAIV
eukprot:COSAG05_NODE_1620_length_4389_cov_56.700466_1_plen_1167_part_00